MAINIILGVFAALLIFTDFNFGPPVVLKLEEKQEVNATNFKINIPSNYTKVAFLKHNPDADYTYESEERIKIFRKISGMMNEEFYIYPSYFIYGKPSKNNFLTNNNFENEFKNKTLTQNEINKNKENNISYLKRTINFAGKVKCTEEISTRNTQLYVRLEKKTYNDTFTKSYSLECPYYNTKGEKDYFYVIALLYPEPYDKKFNEKVLQKANIQFKMDLKEILDSLQINDLDKNKMKKNSLLYDKEYNLKAEEEAKDLILINN